MAIFLFEKKNEIKPFCGWEVVETGRQHVWFFLLVLTTALTHLTLLLNRGNVHCYS